MTKELHRRKHQDSEDSWKSWHGRDYNLKISNTGNVLVGRIVADIETWLEDTGRVLQFWDDCLSLSKIKMCEAKLERNIEEPIAGLAQLMVSQHRNRVPNRHHSCQSAGQQNFTLRDANELSQGLRATGVHCSTAAGHSLHDLTSFLVDL